MPIEILMPALSPTMKEGNLAKWIKKEGDKIKAGEVIAEIETDKATMEVEAVDEGILGKIVISQGTENVAVNSLIALILNDGEDPKSLENYSVKNTVDTSPKVSQTTKTNDVVINNSINSDNKNNNSLLGNSSNFDKVKASPLAKRIAKENNISISQISGSGPHSRVIKDDVLFFMNNSSARSNIVRRNPQEFNAIKNNNIRKVIAKRLLESKQTVPHFYLSCEFKIDKLLELRASLNSAAEIVNEKPSYKISVNDLIIKAVAMALKKVPNANSAWSEEAVLLYNNIDIAVAVAIDGGLITPIIKNADQKTIVNISSEMKELAKKAKEGKLQPEEFQGGSFSISNLGMYGIDNFNAIVNPPQSCILAIGQGLLKPIVEHNQIKIANVMNVTLSSDHRSVDGAVGAEFLKALRSYIENPVLMLIH